MREANVKALRSIGKLLWGIGKLVFFVLAGLLWLLFIVCAFACTGSAPVRKH